MAPYTIFHQRNLDMLKKGISLDPSDMAEVDFTSKESSDRGCRANERLYLPQNHWYLDRILETTIGDDRLVRSVELAVGDRILDANGKRTSQQSMVDTSQSC